MRSNCTFDEYLARFYVDASRFAASAGISVALLDQLLENRLVPQPAYVVTEADRVSMPVFGEMGASGAASGRYFHRESTIWVRRAVERTSGQDTQSTRLMLEREFRANAVAACLEAKQAPSWPTIDEPAVDLELWSATLWDEFLLGTFGLCVAHPVSEREIVRKEWLQSTLAMQSADGTRVPYGDRDDERALALIEAYASASMPFSPVEYPLSSRKRLVDDLRSIIAARRGCHEMPPTRVDNSEEVQGAGSFAAGAFPAT